jgi:hypothetical protein
LARNFSGGHDSIHDHQLNQSFCAKREGEFFTFCHLKREKCTEFPIFIAKYLFEALISTKDKNLPLTILRKVGKITTVPAPPTGELCGNTNRGHG